MMQHTPRTAVVLLTDALDCLDVIEPVAAREPIRLMFRAMMEQCVVSRSLLGKPVNHVLALAEALTAAGRSGRERP